MKNIALQKVKELCLSKSGIRTNFFKPENPGVRSSTEEENDTKEEKNNSKVSENNWSHSYLPNPQYYNNYYNYYPCYYQDNFYSASEPQQVYSFFQ